MPTTAHRKASRETLDRGRRIFRDWTQARWKTQREAAKALGVSQPVISEYISGKQELGGPLLVGIASLDPDTLMAILGRPAQRDRVLAVINELGAEYPEASREVAAKMALAALPPDAAQDTTTRAARGFLGVAEMLSAGSRSVVAAPAGPGRSGRKR